MKCLYQDCECRYQKEMTPKEFSKDDKKSIYRVNHLFRMLFSINEKYTVQTKSCEECELYSKDQVRLSRGCAEPMVVILIIIILLLI